MLVKVLDEKRVKILMEDIDVDFYDLPFEKLNYDDPVSRAFIYDLIQKTFEITGVNFKDCRVMIEVIPGVSKTYYILLTRLENDGDNKIEFDKADISEADVYIFKLTKGIDVLRFCNQIKECEPMKSELYFYNNSYYLILSYSPKDTSENTFLHQLHCYEEFASRCRFNYVNESILREHGKLLIDLNAAAVLAKGDL